MEEVGQPFYGEAKMVRSKAGLRIRSLLVVLSAYGLSPIARAATVVSNENGTVRAQLDQTERDLWMKGGDIPLDGGGICVSAGGTSLSTQTDPKTGELIYYVVCGPGSTSPPSASSCPAGQVSILGVCQAS
jgi:hypothetical protein